VSVVHFCVEYSPRTFSLEQFPLGRFPPFRRHLPLSLTLTFAGDISPWYGGMSRVCASERGISGGENVQEAEFHGWNIQEGKCPILSSLKCAVDNCCCGTGHLRKLCTLKVDQNRLLQLPATIGQSVAISHSVLISHSGLVAIIHVKMGWFGFLF